MGAPAAPRQVPSAAASTDGTAWTAKVLDWVDLPRDAEQLAPEKGAVAGLVVAAPGAYRAPGGGLEQRRIALRAYADHLVLVRARRPLAEGGDGRLRPAGKWQLAAETRRATGTAGVRTGTVPAGPRATVPAPAAGGAAQRNPLAAAARDTEAYLPGPVRADLDRWVPRPVVHVGELVRVSSVPPSHVATVVRLDADRAAVVVARRRDHAEAPWSTTQWAYDSLSTTPSLGAAATPARPAIGGAR
jgi:hypothetical protein